MVLGGPGRGLHVHTGRSEQGVQGRLGTGQWAEPRGALSPLGGVGER